MQLSIQHIFTTTKKKLLKKLKYLKITYNPKFIDILSPNQNIFFLSFLGLAILNLEKISNKVMIIRRNKYSRGF